jgi:cell division transport system permease protein
MVRALYFVREALRGFYQAKLMTLVSVVTIAVSLFVLALAALAAYNVRRFVGILEDRADIVVYLDDTLARDQMRLASVGARIWEFPQVGSIDVIDKERAWQRFREMYGSDMLEMIDENPLPASVEVSMRPEHDTPGSVRDLAHELEVLDGVESVVYSADTVGRLRNFRWSSWIGVVLLMGLCVAVLHFVVANTVKLTIYARRELVVNMRFVGATDRFIETPFILEGILQGAIGAAIAIGAAALFLKPLLMGSSMFAWGPPRLFTLVLATGVLFGWFGSRSAVRKFLD